MTPTPAQVMAMELDAEVNTLREKYREAFSRIGIKIKGRLIRRLKIRWTSTGEIPAEAETEEQTPKMEAPKA